MTIHVFDGGNFKEVTQPSVRDGGSWKPYFNRNLDTVCTIGSDTVATYISTWTTWWGEQTNTTVNIVARGFDQGDDYYSTQDTNPNFGSLVEDEYCAGNGDKLQIQSAYWTTPGYFHILIRGISPATAPPDNDSTFKTIVMGVETWSTYERSAAGASNPWGTNGRYWWWTSLASFGPSGNVDLTVTTG